MAESVQVPDLQPAHRAVLDAVPPYDFRLSLRAMSGFAPCGGEQQVGPIWARKGMILDTAAGPEPVLVELARRADRRPGVAMTVFGRRALDRSERHTAEQMASRWLGLLDDTRAFLRAAAADPPLAPIAAAARGLHQVRFASVSDGVVYFVLTQQTPQRFAASRKRRLAATHGARLRHDGVDHVAFPTLPQLAALDPGRLGAFAANRRQAQYLVNAVREISRIDVQWLYEAPYDEVRARLEGVRGIGDFTCSAILLRVLGRPEGLLTGMGQFDELARRLYGPGATLADVRRRYGPDLGWWSYFARTAAGWAGSPPAATLARSA